MSLDMLSGMFAAAEKPFCLCRMTFLRPAMTVITGRKYNHPLMQLGCIRTLRAVIGVEDVPFYFFLSRSLISVSSFSSADGAGGAGGAAGSSAFFLDRLMIAFTIRKTQKATIRKSIKVWMKLP